MLRSGLGPEVVVTAEVTLTRRKQLDSVTPRLENFSLRRSVEIVGLGTPSINTGPCRRLLD